MKIALIGYGKMGKAIDCLSSGSDMQVVARIYPSAPKQKDKTISRASLGNADVCIHFTSPEGALDQFHAIAECGIPLVIGTTGWYQHLDRLDPLAKQYDIPILYGQNFSIGMLFFQHIVESAAFMADKLDEYDICGIESHHCRKKDSPSGSAQLLGEILLKQIRRKKQIIDSPCRHEAISEDAIHFTSIRCGEDPGTHTLMFDSPFDTIALTHKLRNREGLARGALRAAAWILGKRGVYHFSDILKENL